MKNLKVRTEVHRRLKLHASALDVPLGELAERYLDSAMRAAEGRSKRLRVAVRAFNGAGKLP